jgi:hypothetical protein
MIGYKVFIYFCDVVKIVIIHKKIATFGYRQIVWLETCLIFQYYGYLLYFNF